MGLFKKHYGEFLHERPTTNPLQFRLTVRGYKDDEGIFHDRVGVSKGYDWTTLLSKQMNQVNRQMKITIKKHDENSILFDVKAIYPVKRFYIYDTLHRFLHKTKLLVPALLEVITETTSFGPNIVKSEYTNYPEYPIEFKPSSLEWL